MSDNTGTNITPMEAENDNCKENIPLLTHRNRTMSDTTGTNVTPMEAEEIDDCNEDVSRTDLLESHIRALRQMLSEEKALKQKAEARVRDLKQTVDLTKRQLEHFQTQMFSEKTGFKQQAEARVRDLEQELDLTKRQLEQFQVCHMTHLHNQRIASLSKLKDEHESGPGSVGDNSKLVDHVDKETYSQVEL